MARLSRKCPSPEGNEEISARNYKCNGSSDYLSRPEKISPPFKSYILGEKLKEYKKEAPSCSEITMADPQEIPEEGFDENGKNIYSITCTPAFKENPWTLQHKNSFITPFDSVSCTNEPPSLPADVKRDILWRNMTTLLSSIYAILVIVVGAVLTVQAAVNKEKEKYTLCKEIFGCLISIAGLFWLTFLHIDLNKHKKLILQEMHRKLKEQDSYDSCSMTTEAVFDKWNTGEAAHSQPYRFLKGRHSGSFFLKSGMAAFCFGHLIHEGLLLVKIIDQNMNEAGIVLHTIRPIFSFYQLFIVFKYSNIIINRFEPLARFGLMHCIAASLSVWFATIVEDAQMNKVFDPNTSGGQIKDNSSNFSSQYEALVGSNNTSSNISSQIEDFMPFLYPFTIEFSIILAGVWFVVWQNLGAIHEHANPNHIETKVSETQGSQEITYQSNLVLSADCHAANKGLFAGILCLLAAIVTVIVFSIAMNKNEQQQDIGILIYNTQETVMILVALLSVVLAYRAMTKLDINPHPITFLDDFLLFIPLPFFFINSILSVMVELEVEEGRNDWRIIIQVLIMINVMTQTPFIIDGLRRCSQSHVLRYEKPGREIVTFLIILNITMWIVYTFEHKDAGKYLNPERVYHNTWLYIEHTTIPMMLFYRFHSSVCLADMWKSAYEKEE